MNRAARLALVALTLAGGAIGLRAEEPTKVPSIPLPPESPPRAISPRMAEVLRSTLPTYDEVIRQQAALPKDAPPKPSVPFETDPSVASLPRYVVSENRLPTAAQVMSQRAVEQTAMNRYLGPKDGLDRGVLNAVTIKELWGKIPVLGKVLPCPIPSVTNEERAMARYYEDLRIERKNYLLELGELAAKSGDPAQARQIKRETQNAFKNE